MTLIFATNNAHKLEEARSILPNIRILSLAEIGLHADIPETADTLEGNSLQKAQFVMDWLREEPGRLPDGVDGCFADDTGLLIRALHDAPGVYTARWAGEECSPAANRAKALRELQGVQDRYARFCTVVTYMRPDGTMRQFRGEVPGHIATEESGEHGFGYDPIFIPEGYDETFAVLPAELKNSISHRARAMQAFAKAINPILVFDLGGVVINHNIPLCIEKFARLLGPNLSILGLQPNGEAADIDKPKAADISKEEAGRIWKTVSNAVTSSTLMRDFELGHIGTDRFVESLLPISRPGTTREDILEAWDAMHGGIPEERFAMLREWHLTHHQYALSNNNEEHWAHIHRCYPDFDTYFDALFASHLVHIGKPDSGIFLAAEEVIRQQEPDYSRDRVIFVDDLEANRHAAEQFGWRSAESMETLF